MIYMLAILAIATSANAESGQLLPQAHIDEAMKVGELSGVAEACGMDWQPHYAAYMAAKRSEGTAELDMTFLAAYHGAAQGNAYDMVEKTCSDGQKKQIQEAMDGNIAKFREAAKP